MSAHLCSEAHLSVLAVAIARDPHAQGTEEEIFALLAQENANSLNDRYTAPEECAPEAIAALRFERLLMLERPQAFAPIALIKLAQSYAYQACEHPAWEASRAHALIRGLIDAQIARLPGYESAPWTI